MEVLLTDFVPQQVMFFSFTIPIALSYNNNINNNNNKSINLGKEGFLYKQGGKHKTGNTAI